MLSLGYEENAFQRAIRQDRELKNIVQLQELYEGHQTQSKNKWDSKYGVTAISLFTEKKLIPYKSTNRSQVRYV